MAKRRVFIFLSATIYHCTPPLLQSPATKAARARSPRQDGGLGVGPICKRGTAAGTTVRHVQRLEKPAICEVVNSYLFIIFVPNRMIRLVKPNASENRIAYV